MGREAEGQGRGRLRTGSFRQKYSESGTSIGRLRIALFQSCGPYAVTMAGQVGPRHRACAHRIQIPSAMIRQSPRGHRAGKVNDRFVWNDIAHAAPKPWPDWTNDTTRRTAPPWSCRRSVGIFSASTNGDTANANYEQLDIKDTEARPWPQLPGLAPWCARRTGSKLAPDRGPPATPGGACDTTHTTTRSLSNANLQSSGLKGCFVMALAGRLPAFRNSRDIFTCRAVADRIPSASPTIMVAPTVP